MEDVKNIENDITEDQTENKCICGKPLNLGSKYCSRACSNRGRMRDPEIRARVLSGVSKLWTDPNWSLKKSQEMSNTLEILWKDQEYRDKTTKRIIDFCNEDKELERRSLLASEMNNDKFCDFGKFPKIVYKGVNLRSTYEVAFAIYCDKNNIKWEYEPRRFLLNHSLRRIYTPDFYLQEYNIYIEVKPQENIDEFIKDIEFLFEETYGIKLITLDPKKPFTLYKSCNIPSPWQEKAFNNYTYPYIKR